MHLDFAPLAKAEVAERTRLALPAWFGVDSRYFLLASVPLQGFAPANAVELFSMTNGVVVARMVMAAEKLPSAESSCVPSWYASHWPGGISCRADLDLLGLSAKGEEQAVPDADLTAGSAAATAAGKDGAAVTAALARLRARAIKPYTFELFAGPKQMERLESTGHNLAKSIDFGWFGLIAHPMLMILKFFHSLAGSWPLAILLLTILVKGILWPFTHKSIKSMRGMQKIKPELDAMRKDLEEKAKKQGLAKADPTELNKLTFELYKSTASIRWAVACR